MMKKTYEAPQTTMVCANPTTLMAASGSGSYEYDKTPGTDPNPNIPGNGSIGTEDGGESFSKGTSFNVWEE